MFTRLALDQVARAVATAAPTSTSNCCPAKFVGTSRQSGIGWATIRWACGARLWIVENQQVHAELHVVVRQIRARIEVVGPDHQQDVGVGGIHARVGQRAAGASEGLQQAGPRRRVLHPVDRVLVGDRISAVAFVGNFRGRIAALGEQILQRSDIEAARGDRVAQGQEIEGRGGRRCAAIRKPIRAAAMPKSRTIDDREAES